MNLSSWGTGASSESNFFGYGTTSIWGNFLALIGAWAASGYILAGRKVRPHISLPVYTFLVYGISAIFLIAAVFVTGTKMTGFSNLTYVWLLLLAVIPQLIGHSTFNWALRYIPASVVSIALLGEPVGSTVLAIFFLKENPTLIEIGGGVLILAGIYLSSRESNKNSPPA